MKDDELSNRDYLLKRAYDSGLRDPKELAAFMGQMEVESGRFASMHEQLNFRAPSARGVVAVGAVGKASTNRTARHGRESRFRAAMVLVVLVLIQGVLSKPAESVAQVRDEHGGAGARDNALVRVRCGNQEMFLRAVGERFARTTLHMKKTGGAVIDLKQPDEMANFTPIGVGCDLVQGIPYFVVQYGGLPYSCKVCEWFYLYDDSGVQLTSSIPAVLFDETLSIPDKYFPNNKQFYELCDKLGIDLRRVDIAGFDCIRDEVERQICVKEHAHE